MRKIIAILDLLAFILLILVSVMSLLIEGIAISIPWVLCTLWCGQCLSYKYKQEKKQ